MTSPNNEVASLLLRVGVDFSSLEDFVTALPAIPEVVEAVGQRLDALQVGNPAIFREKGAELVRAMVTGLQAEAAGLSVGGNLSEVIFGQVFGDRTMGLRTAQEYVGRIQGLLDTLRVEVPQVAQDLISPNAVRGLENIVGGAANARREVEALTAQLGMLRAEMASLQFTSARQLPAQLVRRAAGGGVEFAPGARLALENQIQTVARPFGNALPDPNRFAVEGRAGVNLAATNRAVTQEVQRLLSDGISRLADRVIPNVSRLTEIVSAPAAPRNERLLDRLQVAAEPVVDTMRALDRAAAAAVASEQRRIQQEEAHQARRARLQNEELLQLRAGVEARRLDPRRQTLTGPDFGAVRVLHGTTHAFQDFDPRRQNTIDRALFGQGIYLAEDNPQLRNAGFLGSSALFNGRELANRFAGTTESGARNAGFVGINEGDAPNVRIASLRPTGVLDFEKSGLTDAEIVQAFQDVAVAMGRPGVFAPGRIDLNDEPSPVSAERLRELRQDFAVGARPNQLVGPGMGMITPKNLMDYVEQSIWEAIDDQGRAAFDNNPTQIGKNAALASVARGRGADVIRASEFGTPIYTVLDPAAIAPFPFGSPLDNTLSRRSRALPAGVGLDDAYAENERRRADRLAARLAEISARRDLELLEPGGPGFRGTGLAIGGPLTTRDPRPLQPPLQVPSEAELSRFVREMNTQILRAIDVQGQRNSDTASSPEVDPEALERAMRRTVLQNRNGQLVSQTRGGFEGLIQGRGISLSDLRAAGLEEEQLRALGLPPMGDIEALGQRRVFPPALIDREQALREYLAQQEVPGTRDPRALASQTDIENTRRAQRQLELQARAAAAQQAELGLSRARLAITQGRRGDAREILAEAAAGITPGLGREPIALGLPNVAGGIPGAPPLTRGAPAGPIPQDVEAAARRRAANIAALEAAGINPAEFFARADAVAQAIPAAALGGATAAAATAAESTRRENARRRLEEAGAGGGGRIFVGGLGGVELPGTGVVPTGIGRGVPGIPGVEGIRAQREELRRLEAQARETTTSVNSTGAALARIGGPGARVGGGAAGVGGGGGRRGGGGLLFDPFGNFDPNRDTGFPFPPFGPPPPPGGAGGGGRGGFPPFGTPFGPTGRPFGPEPESFFSRARRGAREGFLGAEDGDSVEFLARSAASAARFSLVYGAAYGALRLFTTAFSEGVQGAIAFETALTELNIVTERTGRSNENFARSLADLGASRGLDGAETVAAGARAIGLFGAVDAPRAEQERIARISADVATMGAALDPGASVEAIQTQLAGITRSFKIAPENQEQILDIASFIGRRSGRPAPEVLSALAQIGTLGESGGFDLPQVAAIITRITSGTGQTPQAVSGFLSQVLSKANDPATERRLRGLGVDTQGTTLAQQFEQLSQMNLSQEQLNRVTTIFGRGRSGQAAQTIIRDFGAIEGLAETARTDSAGLARKDFEQIINTVGGQLRTLGASLKDLFVGIASSGILDVFVALLSATQLVVDVLDLLVDTFNLIPREVRTAVFALGTLAGAVALIGRVGRNTAIGGALLNAAGAAPGDGFFRGLGRSAAERGRAVGNLPAGAGLAAVLTGIGGLFARRTGQVFEPTGVVDKDGIFETAARGGRLTPTALGGGAAIAAGVALAVGIIDAVQDSRAVDRALRNAGTILSTANTEEELDASITAADAAVKAARDRDTFDPGSKDILTLGLGTVFANLFGGSDADLAQANELKAIAEERARRRQELADADPAGVFGSFDVESLGLGMEELSERGFTAAQRLELLNQAFDGLIAKGAQSADVVGVIFQGQGERVARDVAAGVLTLGQNQVASLRDDARLADPYTGGIASDIAAFGGNAAAQALGLLPGASLLTGGKDFSTDARKLREQADKFEEQLNEPGLQDRLSENLQEVLRSRGKDPSLGPVQLTAEDTAAIQEGQLAILEETFGPGLKEVPAAVRDFFLAALPGNIRQSLGDFNGANINDTNVRSFLQFAFADAQTAGADLALTSGSNAQGAQEALRQAEAAIARASAGAAQATTPQAADEINRQIAQRQSDLIKLRLAASSALRQEAESFLNLRKSELSESDVQGRLALDLQFVEGVLSDPALGVEDRNRFQAQQNNLVRQQIEDARKTANLHEVNHIDPGNAFALLEQDIRNAQSDLAVATEGSLAYEEAQRALNQLNESRERYLTQNALSVIGVNTNPNNSAQQARDAFDRAVVQYNAAVANGDPNEINASVQALNQARFADRDARIAAIVQRNEFDTVTDPGSGIQNAAQELFAAQIDLQRYDEGSGEYFAALQRLRRAQIGTADAARAYSSTLRQLSGDITNPLENARDALADITDELNAARARGAAPDTIANLELQQRQASNNLERTAFQQRMDQFRTRNQLGEITDSAYLDYLNSEKARLEAIQNRTFQQQEFLNQVNQAILGLNDQLQGQFNLGDIDVPAPFEARRLLATPGGGGAQAITTVNLTINGGDMNQVRGVVAQYLGPVALSKTPTVTPTRI